MDKSLEELIKDGRNLVNVAVASLAIVFIFYMLAAAALPFLNGEKLTRIEQKVDGMRWEIHSLREAENQRMK